MFTKSNTITRKDWVPSLSDHYDGEKYGCVCDYTKTTKKNTKKLVGFSTERKRT